MVEREDDAGQIKPEALNLRNEGVGRSDQLSAELLTHCKDDPARY